MFPPVTGAVDDAGHHVQRGVQSHEGITPCPVELQADGFADLQRDRSHVQDAVGERALAGISDRNALPAGPGEESRIAGLAAAQGVENRAIQLDPALVDLGHLPGRPWCS